MTVCGRHDIRSRKLSGWSYLQWQTQCREKELEVGLSCELEKLVPSDKLPLPPTGTKHSSTQPCQVHSHSNHHTCVPIYVLEDFIASFGK